MRDFWIKVSDELLMVNDDCNNLFEKYNRYMVNRACDTKEDATSESNLIELDDQTLNQQLGALKTSDASNFTGYCFFFF